MDDLSKAYFADLRSGDPNRRYEAFNYLMKETQRPVTWAYEVWDEMVLLLTAGDNHERAISGQILANLAKSDPAKRMVDDLDKIVRVTHDERYVTGRHVLQSLWKIGIVDRQMQDLVEQQLAGRYDNCASEKNRTLIRFDIIENYRKLFDQFRDPAIKDRALALIDKEPDERYRRKFRGVWKHSDPL